jgi:hypothetical protein
MAVKGDDIKVVIPERKEKTHFVLIGPQIGSRYSQTLEHILV